MEVYTPEEAGKILKLATCTVQELCKTGKMNCSKVGRMYRITDEDIKEFLNATKKK